MRNSKEEVLTLQEVAEYLKISEMTLLRLANQGRVPGVKIGRQWRFSRETILNLVRHPSLIFKKGLRS